MTWPRARGTETVGAIHQTQSVDTFVSALDQALRHLGLVGIFDAACVLIVAFLLVRLFLSIVSTTDIGVIKRRALLSAWISAPAILLFIEWLNGFWIFGFVTFIGSLLWTDAFGCLVIGGWLRQRLRPTWKAPDPLSLPLATLVFTISAVILFRLVFNYLIFPEIIGCIFAPASNPCVPSALGAYAALALLGLLVACGVVLPADSNLVVGFDRIVAFTRSSLARYRAKRRERSESASQAQAPVNGGGSYPPPALYTPAVADTMRLKLQRSQRISMFGTVIFVLDARMELTKEEHELLVKYRLGNDVIYESSSRKRQKESTLAHLEMTKGGPSLRDSAGAQLWGMAKTMFWLGRAGISATSAALSLRITINSLISGVHVECKSMGELIGAKNAIREAAQNLRAYLDVAVTFDGREEIIEL